MTGRVLPIALFTEVTHQALRYRLRYRGSGTPIALTEHCDRNWEHFEGRVSIRSDAIAGGRSPPIRSEIGRYGAEMVRRTDSAVPPNCRSATGVGYAGCGSGEAVAIGSGSGLRPSTRELQSNGAASSR